MAVKLPIGSILSVAASYSAAKPFTAISNAAEGVASMASGHALAVGDLVEITSGWSKIDQRLARVKAVSSDNVTLEGINTTDTVQFPVGSSAGSLRKILTRTQIDQVLEVATSGGEQQFVNYSFLEDGVERQIPSTKSAQSMTLTLGDDPTRPWYATLDAADADKLPRGLILTLAGGSVILFNTFATLNKTPSLSKTAVMSVTATFSFIAPVTRYAS